MPRFLVMLEHPFHPGSTTMMRDHDVIEAADREAAANEWAAGIEGEKTNAKLFVFELGAPFKIVNTSLTYELKEPRA